MIINSTDHKPHTSVLPRTFSVIMASLENLGSDVIFLLLNKAPNINILWGFIRASPRMFSVFCTYRDIILSTVIAHDIGHSILVDAQAALHSSRFTPRGLPESECLKWIAKYQYQLLNKSSVSGLNSVSDAINVWQIHRDVKFLARLFVQEKLHLLSGFEGLQNTERSTQRDYTLEDLSESEKLRPFRSIYRYAIYSDLFFFDIERPGIKKISRLGAYDQAHSFLVLFPAWQVEELSCINDFIHDNILQKWQEVEDTVFTTIARDPSSWGKSTLDISPSIHAELTSRYCRHISSRPLARPLGR